MHVNILNVKGTLVSWNVKYFDVNIFNHCAINVCHYMGEDWRWALSFPSNDETSDVTDNKTRYMSHWGPTFNCCKLGFPSRLSSSLSLSVSLCLWLSHSGHCCLGTSGFLTVSPWRPCGEGHSLQGWECLKVCWKHTPAKSGWSLACLLVLGLCSLT